MQLYSYDKEKMTFKKVKKRFFVFTSVSLVTIVVLSFLLGTIVGGVTVKATGDKHKDQKAFYSTQDEEEHAVWKDSVFSDYKKRADLWLSRPIFQGTPLNGDIMSLAARNAYDSTGILLPVELALTQAQMESGMGREGKSPKNNPYNVGENDSGTVIWYDNTFEGVQAYYYLMCKNYLRCRDVEDLFVNFVNCSGHRYASSETYEVNVRNQYYVIKNWINRNLE